MIGEWFVNIDWVATGGMVGGLSTFTVALLTCILIKENKLLRKAGNSPLVVAHFETHPDGNGAVLLAFSNVGTGPALDVSYKIECDQNDFDNYEIIIRDLKERPPLTMIGQGEKFSFIFAVGFNLFRPKDPGISKRLKPFGVKVSWRSVDEMVQSASYSLDVSTYSGLPGIASKSPLVKIADELSAIKQQLAKLVSSQDGLASFIDTTEIEQGTRAVVKGKSAEVD
ncbi:hypothetical protein ACW7G2_03960 [Luteimonas sp. A277]